MTPILSTSPRWILYKHTSNFDIIRQTAIELKFSTGLSKENKADLLHQLKSKGLYTGRNPEEPLDSIQHRINTLLYYMFGYREGKGDFKKFSFSPLGNLFLRNLDSKANLEKILLTMVWGKQFPDPFFGTDPSISVFPFRLLFELMSDSRLNQKLTTVEYAHLVSRVESIDQTTYENLVEQILELRSKSYSEVEQLFAMDVHHHVNAFHEWQYTRKLLSSLGLIVNSEGSRLFSLLHGKGTKRWVDSVESQIAPSLKNLVDKYRKAYPYFTKPVSMNDPERLRVDAIREVYSFLPVELIEEIEGASNSVDRTIAELLKSMARLSLNQEGGAPDGFEEKLTAAFNLFSDVQAEWIGGPGNTDIECMYLTGKTKFAVDAKSTSRKLGALNAGRLKLHREKISAKYTIVITPSFAPSALTDIRDSEVTILLVNTFKDYLFNALNSQTSGLSYEDLHQIVVSNLGTDITPLLSELTLSKYGISIAERDIVAFTN